MGAEIPKSIRASLYIDGKPAEGTLKNLKTVTQTLRRELDGLTVGTESWNVKMRELQQHERALRNIQNEVKGVGGAFGWLKTELGKLGAVAIGVLGFQFITDQFHNVIMAGAKLSDSLADIRRVAGLTEQEVLNLNRSLKEIDTRTSSAGLREIAIIAGKLGVAKGEIASFTEAVDKLVVTLGDELGSADQITTQLGKILNVYDGKVTGDNITHLGNAMVVLANAGVASGGFIADFTQRVAGIAKSSNLSLGSTIGLAAGLEELGQKAESSSTAITKVLSDISNDLPKAASIAQIPLEKFTKLFADSPEKALLAYASGLVKNKSAFSEITASFKDAGEEGARVVGTLAALGQKSEFMQGKIDLANKSLTESSAINAGFALKNETFGASVDKLGKKFAEVGSNSAVTDFMKSLVLLVSAGIDKFNKYATAVGTLFKLLIIGGTAWATYGAYMAAANSQWLAFIVNMVSGEAVMALSRTSTIALAGVNALLSGNFAKAAKAARLLNITMMENPIVLVAAALVAAVVAVTLFKDATDDATVSAEALNKVKADAAEKVADEKMQIEELNKIMTDQNEQYSTRIAAMQKLKELLPDHLKGYKDEQLLAGEASTAVKDYIKQLEKRAEAESAYEALRQLYAEKRKIQSEGADLSWWQTAKAGAFGAFGGQAMSTVKSVEYADNNKTNALHKNQLQIDALKSTYDTELKQALTGESGKPEAGGPFIETVAARRTKLENEIKALKQAYSDLALTDKTGQAKNLAAQAFKQKELDALEGKTDKQGPKDKKKQESLAQSSAKLSQMVKEFNAQQLAEQMAANQKEIQQVENKYDHLIDAEKAWLKNNPKATAVQKKTHTDEIDQLEVDKKAATDAIKLRQEQDYTDKVKQLRIGLGQEFENELQKQENQINTFFDEQLKAGGDKDKIEVDRAQAVADAKIDEHKRFLEEVSNIDSQSVVTEAQKEQLRKAQINKRYDDDVAALKKKYSDQLIATEEFQDALAKIEKNRKQEIKQKTTISEKEKNKAIQDVSIQAAQDLANGVFEIGRANRQAEADAQISKLEKQKERELSNQDLTEGQRNAITERYQKQENEVKLKAWEADKAASLQQAEINGILAVTKAMTSAPWPLNLISAAGAAVAAGVEIAKISSMKPPEFAQGGLTDQDPAGYVGQATIFKNSASGRPFVAGEAGREWIAPNWMLQNPRTANIIGMLESARKEKRAFAGGGFNGGTPGAASVIHNNFDNSEMLKEMRLTRQAIQDQQVTFNDRAYDRYRENKVAVKNAANA